MSIDAFEFQSVKKLANVPLRSGDAGAEKEAAAWAVTPASHKATAPAMPPIKAPVSTSTYIYDLFMKKLCWLDIGALAPAQNLGILLPKLLLGKLKVHSTDSLLEDGQ